MAESPSEADPHGGPHQRSAWIDGTLAALVGVGYGLALFNSPTTWLIAVVLLFLAMGWYAFFTLRFVRRGGRRATPEAQRAHGLRLIVLFAVAYLLTRLTPTPEWRVWLAVAGGVLIGLGGFLVLRWEARGSATGVGGA